MKFAAAICAFLILAILATDDGVERQRRLADGRMSNDYTQVRRVS